MAKKAAEFEKVIAPLRQMIAITEAVKKNLDFTSILSDMATNVGLINQLSLMPEGAELPPSFTDKIEDSMMKATLDGIIAGILAGGPVKDAIDEAMAPVNAAIDEAFSDDMKIDPIEAEDIAQKGRDAAGKVAGIFAGLAPVFQALGIDIGQGLLGGLNFNQVLTDFAATGDTAIMGASIQDEMKKSVLNGIVEGMLASGPIKDAMDKVNKTVTEAYAKAMEDGVMTAEESANLASLAEAGGAEVAEQIEQLKPLFDALGISFGGSLVDGIKQQRELAVSAMGDILSAKNVGKQTVEVDGKQLNKFDAWRRAFARGLYDSMMNSMTKAFFDAAMKSTILSKVMTLFSRWVDAVMAGNSEKADKIMDRILNKTDKIIKNADKLKEGFNLMVQFGEDLANQLGIGGDDLAESSDQAAANIGQATRGFEKANEQNCGDQCELNYRLAKFGIGTDMLDQFGRGASFTASTPTAIPKAPSPGLQADYTKFGVTGGETKNEIGKFNASRFQLFEKYPDMQVKPETKAEYDSLVQAKNKYTGLGKSFIGYLSDNLEKFLKKINPDWQSRFDFPFMSHWSESLSNNDSSMYKRVDEAIMSGAATSNFNFLRALWNDVELQFEKDIMDRTSPSSDVRKEALMWNPDFTSVSGFAQGGIASGPRSGYPVLLHGTEAIIPADSGRIRASSTGAPSIVIEGETLGNGSNQVKSLEDRISRLEAAIANLVDAIGSQPIEVSVKIDDNELMRSVEKVGRRAGRSGKRLIDTGSVSR